MDKFAAEHEPREIKGKPVVFGEFDGVLPGMSICVEESSIFQDLIFLTQRDFDTNDKKALLSLDYKQAKALRDLLNLAIHQKYELS